MYRVLRRISSSFFPRPDRPWNEDATSTAPQIEIGRKRRLSSTEPDAPPVSVKKRRAESVERSEDASRAESPAHPEKETEEVKEVTKGVEEVELDESKPKEAQPSAVDPSVAAAVPLPDSPTLQATQDAQEVEGVTEPVLTSSVAAKPDSVAQAGASQLAVIEAEAATSEEQEKWSDIDAHGEVDDEIPGLIASAGADKAEVVQPAVVAGEDAAGAETEVQAQETVDAPAL